MDPHAWRVCVEWRVWHEHAVAVLYRCLCMLCGGRGYLLSVWAPQSYYDATQTKCAFDPEPAIMYLLLRTPARESFLLQPNPT